MQEGFVCLCGSGGVEISFRIAGLCLQLKTDVVFEKKN